MAALLAHLRSTPSGSSRVCGTAGASPRPTSPGPRAVGSSPLSPPPHQAAGAPRDCWALERGGGAEGIDR